jgi:hypothetical protein
MAFAFLASIDFKDAFLFPFVLRLDLEVAQEIALLVRLGLRCLE